MGDETPAYLQRYEERYNLETEAVAEEARPVLEELAGMGMEAGSWVTPESRDAFRRAFISESGVEAFISDFQNGSDETVSSGQVRLSPVHAVVWACEILGQISDGAWENYWGPESGTAYDAWEWYWDLEIVVDEDVDGVVFDVSETPPSTSMDVRGNLTKFDEHVGRIAFFMSAVEPVDSVSAVESVLEDFDEALETVRVEKRGSTF